MEILLTGSPGTALLLTLLWFGGAGIAGAIATSGVWRAFFAGERVLIAITTGVVLSTFAAFLLSMAFGVSPFVVWLSPVLVALIASVFTRTRQVRILRPIAHSLRSRTDRWGLIVLGLSILFFLTFSGRLIMWNSGAMTTGIIDNWGDLPFHLGIITSFLNGGAVPPPNPSLAGHSLVYPFLSDFLAAMLVRIRVPLEYAVELPNILMNSVSLTLLFYLGYRLVKNRAAAALAPLLFVLAGGLGFLWFLADVYNANTPVWEMLVHLPKRYTSLGDQGIRWINPTLAHLLPQRSFLFGFPLMLSIILLLWTGRNGRREEAWFPGLLAGLLPFSHMHSFMALMMATGIMAVTAIVNSRRKNEVAGYWLRFFGSAALIAGPQLLFFMLSRVDVGSAIRFEPGWMAGDENLVWFWIKNTGAILLLIAVALVFYKRIGLRKDPVKFVIPFLALFIIGNLFLFSPIPYDTNKIFVFSFLLGMPFVALVLIRMFRSPSWLVSGLVFRLLFVSLIFSGVLNLVHELQSGGWQEFSGVEIDLAERIRRDSPTDAIFLSAPVHNTLLMLAGRPVVLGYPSHVYSHGVDPATAEDQVKRMYAGGDDAPGLLRDHGVSFVLVGPEERSRYGNAVEWLHERYPAFLRSDNYVVYRIQ